MQRSSRYVLYKVISESPNAPTVYSYYATVDHWKGTSNADADKSTPNLNHAVIFDKAGAFAQAVEAAKDGWSVGELVSDRNGVHIEE